MDMTSRLLITDVCLVAVYKQHHISSRRQAVRLLELERDFVDTHQMSLKCSLKQLHVHVLSSEQRRGQ